jgi:amino acid adenylation domain-containing protein
MEMEDRIAEIAVVGMSGRFPGARSVAEFWSNLAGGVESISFFTPGELLAEGLAPEVVADPCFVPAHGAMAGAYAFDASFFGVTPAEARAMDPQQRVFLECAWSALEDAGCDPARFPGPIGVYAGSGASGYLSRVLDDAETVETVGVKVALFGNEKDYLTTRASYKLGLRGPSVAVQTACSTSLVAIHVACQALLGRECDLALAGGVGISGGQVAGYTWQEGGILAPDGHCRAFDARAGGTVGGSGAGVVALKRMADALRDGDSIYAVVKGSAINNDGTAKVGFTAPSVEGQAAAISEALAAAGVDPSTVGYVEAHGTGTALGDPIEIAALTEVFGAEPRHAPCALGAVKTNIGHLDAASGVAGFIKTVLALKHRTLPPTLHFTSPNPETGLEGSPFVVNTELREWAGNGTPRRAGVSSFGMGGTNAHAVLEEAPELPPTPPTDAAQLLVLSARTGAALARMRQNLAGHLAENPGLPLADAAFTLQEGRAAFRHRWAAVARTHAEAGDALAGTAQRRPAERRAAERTPPVAFLFPGQGTQYAGMARELYAREPVFRREVDRCAALLAGDLGMDLRASLFPPAGGEDEADELLRQTCFTQPALFTVEYALAKTWMAWGVEPESMIGHSVGEYVAACLAGVFTPEAALRLVAARGRLMGELPGGAMMAVPLPEAEVRAHLAGRMAIAAVNGAASCVVSGVTDELDELEARLAGGGIEARRLHTSHAFHSAAMDPILDAFAAEVRRARPAAPSLPFVSNVTGDWITAGEATDPAYWVRHLRETVRFADGVARLLEDPSRVLLEVGPGEALGTFARRSADGAGRVIVKSLPRADRPDGADLAMLEAAGALWTAGVAADWAALRGPGARRRVPLPTYPFEQTEYRVAPRRAAPSAPADARAIVPAPGTDASPEPSETVATETTQAPDRLARITARVAELFARLLGVQPAELDPGLTFLEQGADSLLLMQASRTVESAFGVRVPFRLLLDGLSTLADLAAHLEREAPPEADPAPEAPAPAAVQVPVLALAIAANGHGSNGHAPNGHGSNGHHLPVNGDASGLEAILNTQLAIMQQQLELLRGAAHPAAPAGNGVAGANGNGSNGHASADGHASPSGQGAGGSGAKTAPSSSTPTPAVPINRVKPAIEEKKPAAHGPHRPVTATKGLGAGHSERQARHFAALVEAYTARTAGSKAYAAGNRLALADNRASLNFRQATKEVMYPVVGARSEGSRLWDVDGNEYVDFTMGFGAHFFGHRPPFVVAAVDEQLRRGFHLGPQSDLAGPTAALFRELTGMERVTFCNTGSEAVMTALRIARTVTGRDRVVCFEGSYHGCFDGTLACATRAVPGAPSRPVAPGTPRGMVEDLTVLKYGDPAALAWLEENCHDVAAVVVEAVQNRDPEFHPREFVHALRGLTRRTGTALVFDEMITGLRLGLRGAQAWYGVDADMATYGKVIGGGFPMGVVAGTARMMDAIDGGQWSYGDDSFPAADQTFFAGTFCKHPVAMAAAHAVLVHLKESGPALYDEVHARAARLVAGLRGVLEEERVPVRIIHAASLFRFVFMEAAEYADLLFHHMILRGIYIWEGRACFLSTAHTDEDCERMVDALRESIHALREGGFLPEKPGGGGGEPAAVTPALRLFPATAAGAPRTVPLTPAQRQVWVHAQLGDDASRAYNEQVVLGLRGRLDVDALRAALEDLVARHESLRTVFDPSGEAQHVLPALPGPLPLVVDDPAGAGPGSGALARAMEEAVRGVFDLAAGPLFRARVHEAGGGRQVVQLVVHHLVADGISVPILRADLEAAYRARHAGHAPRLEPAMQFSEYAGLMAAHVETYAGAEAEWLARFEGAAPLVLPSDRPRPRFPSHRAGTARLTLPEALSTELRGLGRKQGCTLFMTLLGGLLATLHRVSGQDDLVVGISSAGRPFPGSGTLVGHCVDVLPVRSRAGGAGTAREFLAGVRDSLLDAYENEVFSYARLHERLRIPRGPSLPPLISVTFSLEPGGGGHEDGATFGGVELEAVSGAAAPFTKFDLTLDAVDTGGEIEVFCLFNADLFERATVQRILGHVRRVLEQVAAHPAAPLAELDLLTEDERRMVLDEWNRTAAAYPADRCIHQLFEAQAARTPDAVAVAYLDRALTYAELDARANRLASHLARLGVGPEVRVGLCLERGLELMVAILGVMKAGGAYVPVDPAHPADRVAYILGDAAVAAVVTQDRLRASLPADGGVPVVAIDAEWERIEAEPGAAPRTAVTPENLAYVIYTSGSTGRPKGVAMHHRGVCNYIDWGIRHYGADAGSGAPVFSSMAVDLTITNLLPLFCGHPVRFLPEENAVEALAEALRGKPGFGLIKITPVHLSLLTPLLTPDEARGAARTLVVGADFLSAEPTVFWQDHAPGVRLMNEYGPTETVVGCSAYTLPPGLHRNGPVPVGGPIQNLTFYVLDARMRPVPVGFPGELFIGGAGVARGYLGRPGLTAEKFVPDPFAGAGARMYRTGDRARWLEGGNLLILGRTDNQVKIRGYRVELGEIEAVLRRHEAVRGALVVVREDVPGDRRLVAYVAAGADTGVLRAHLRAALPEHMVPSAFVRLDALPNTATGKIDPRTLPAPVYESDEERHVAPRTPTEEALAAIWAEVLATSRVGVHDVFFEMGGNSLLATRVASRVRGALAVEVTVRAIFEAPTVAALAERVDALKGDRRPRVPPVLPAARDVPPPLSFGQERLRFLERMEPGSALYNVSSTLRLRGALHLGALERAIGEVVRRHEVLRTTFAEDGGRAVQVIAPFAGYELPVEDLPGATDAEARRAASREASLPFDLSAAPAFRARLFRLADDDHVLVVALHHAACDGWSMDVLHGELAELYGAFRQGKESPLAPLPVQYADFAAWQRERLRGPVLDHLLAYWRERMAGAPALLEVPTDHPRPAVRSAGGAWEPAELSAALTARVEALARREGATPYMVLMAAFQVLLSRYAGTDDVVVGSPVAGRTGEEVERLIGFFVNTLCIRTDLGGDPTFREALRRVREVTLGAYEHQELPFETLVEALQPERSLSHAPLFQAMFILHGQDERGEGGLPGLRTEALATDLDSAKYDLTLSLFPTARGLRGGLEYSTDLFERGTIRRMLEHLERVVDQVTADPDRRVSRLTLTSPAERERLLRWNQTAAGIPDGGCLHHLFEEQARRTPGAYAVICGGERVTYAELDARANRLAGHLRGLGAGPEARVGILLERGTETIVSILGVLKAGAAYVPMDAAHPAERLGWIIGDAGVSILVTQERLQGRAGPLGGVHLCRVDADAAVIAARPAQAPATGGMAAENLCYVIYTSGSTGRPKGVLMHHRGVCNYVHWALRAYPAGQGAAPLFSSIAVDLPVTNLLPLFAGQPVHVLPEEQPIEALADLLRTGPGLGLVKITPVHLELLAGMLTPGQAAGAARALVIGGDILAAESTRFWQRHAPGTQLVNEYGPTETVVGSSAYFLPAGRHGAGPTPVGRPIQNLRFYVLDPHLEPVPVGLPGELYIGGAGVARGYLGRPALTAEKFVPEPFAEPGARMYRTGDRARWLADGGVMILGRTDHQVKVRGYRVEAGEIEAALRRHPAVRQCLVIVREDVPGDRRLVAYVVGADQAAEPAALREHLRQSLPEYMVPGAFVRMEGFPKTATGKIDHRTLPVPEYAAEAGYVAPRTPMEEVLAEVWAEVLGVDRVGAADDFFALGGHSLLIMRLIARLRSDFGVDLPIRAVFTAPTLAEMAARVEQAIYLEVEAMDDDEAAALAGPQPVGGGR